MEMLQSGDFVSTISILPWLSPAQFLYEGDSEYLHLSQASPAVVKEGESLTESLPEQLLSKWTHESHCIWFKWSLLNKQIL